MSIDTAKTLEAQGNAQRSILQPQIAEAQERAAKAKADAEEAGRKAADAMFARAAAGDVLLAANSALDTLTAQDALLTGAIRNANNAGDIWRAVQALRDGEVDPEVIAPLEVQAGMLEAQAGAVIVPEAPAAPAGEPAAEPAPATDATPAPTGAPSTYVGGLLISGTVGPFGPLAPSVIVDVTEGECTVQIPCGSERPLEAIAFSRVGEGRTALRALYQGARDVFPSMSSADDLPLPYRAEVNEAMCGNLSDPQISTWARFFSDSAGQVEVVYHLKAAAAPAPAAAEAPSTPTAEGSSPEAAAP